MEKKIKIALFVPWLKSKGGVERIVLSILKDKRYCIDLYTLGYDKEKTFSDFKEFKVRQIGSANTNGFLRKGAGLFFGLLTKKIKNLDKYDIFMISTAGIAELAVFRNRHSLTIALTHTPLRVAHSMYNYYRTSSLKFRMSLPILVPIYRILERNAWKHISYAIVLSDEVRSRLVGYKLIDSNRIFKIGPNADFGKHSKGRVDKVIFYPSRFIPYKRQDLAVKAFIKSKLPSLGFKLVIGGFVESESYFKTLKELSAGRSDIIIERDISEKRLRELYSKCYATLFLAINEDTGLVPLESLAYGKPVVSANEGGPREFIKNGVNGILVEANEADLAGALNKILDKRYYENLRKGALNSPVYDERLMIKNLDTAIDNIIRRGRTKNKNGK
jgi:glycosyltransferase involved in cell wall biosynthesis